MVPKILAYENFFYPLDEDGFHVASLAIAVAFIVYLLGCNSIDI